MANFKYMTLKFKVKPISTGALTLEYINDYPEVNELFVLEILKKHCLPYNLDPSSPMSREIARSCASSLEAAATAIREMWNLSVSHQQFSQLSLPPQEYRISSSNNFQTISQQVVNSSVLDNDEEKVPVTTALEEAYEEKRQKRLGI